MSGLSGSPMFPAPPNPRRAFNWLSPVHIVPAVRNHLGIILMWACVLIIIAAAVLS